MATSDVDQHVEETPLDAVHRHPAVVHTHDHYHVSHHHRGGMGDMLGEFEHRAYWHTHAHNHLDLTHGHEHAHAEENVEHGKEAHIHDHAEPTG